LLRAATVRESSYATAHQPDVSHDAAVCVRQQLDHFCTSREHLSESAVLGVIAAISQLGLSLRSIKAVPFLIDSLECLELGFPGREKWATRVGPDRSNQLSMIDLHKVVRGSLHRRSARRSRGDGLAGELLRGPARQRQALLGRQLARQRDHLGAYLWAGMSRAGPT
jgi:hypothetical protein